MQTYTYTYNGANVDPSLFFAEMNVVPFINTFFNAWIVVDTGDFIVEVTNNDFKVDYDNKITELLNTYTKPINGPLKELENVEIEHTYTAEVETVIHSVDLNLFKPSWIYITLSGSSVVGANDIIQHRINLTTGEEITNNTVVTEGLASGVSNSWSRVWWLYVTEPLTTFELHAEFIPDISSEEPYEQNTTLTLIIHEAI